MNDNDDLNDLIAIRMKLHDLEDELFLLTNSDVRDKYIEEVKEKILELEEELENLYKNETL